MTDIFAPYEYLTSTKLNAAFADEAVERSAADASLATADETETAARIAGDAGSTVRASTIAALRAITDTRSVLVEGYYAPADGGEGTFIYVASDTTSADNGGTIIVDAMARRWYRQTGGQPSSVRWFGVVGDNQTSDQTAFQSAISACANGDLYVPFGAYLVSGLSCAAPITIHLGEGSVVRAAPGMNAPVFLVTGDNVTFTGKGTIDANGQVGTGGAPEPIYAANTSGLTIDGISLTNSMNYGIHTLDCSQVTIKDCVITKCNFYSIACYTVGISTKDYVITGNRIDRSDVSYDPTGAGHCIAALWNASAGVTVENGIVANNACIGKFNPATQGCGITTFANTTSLQPFFNWAITGNVVKRGYFGLSVGQGVGFTITGNSVFDHKAYGIEMPGLQDGTCAGNTVFGGTASTHGIVADATAAAPSTGLAISGNTVKGCATAGILTFQFCNDISIAGNVIVQTAGDGIQTQNGSDIVISGNTINGSGTATGHAIDMTSTDGNAVVSGNNFRLWGAGGNLNNAPAGAQVFGNKFDTGALAETFLLSGGSPLKGFVSATGPWTPGVIGSGVSISTVIAAIGAAVGDPVTVSFNPTLVAGLMAFAAAGAGTAIINIMNASGASITVPAESIKVNVWKS